MCSNAEKLRVSPPPALRGQDPRPAYDPERRGREACGGGLARLGSLLLCLHLGAPLQAGGAGGTVVDSPPILVAQPVNQVEPLRGSASFSVWTTGSEPQTFQWQFGGADLPGATNRSLTLANLGASDTGTYRVVVGNAFGATASSNALLSVVQVMAWSDGFAAPIPAELTNVVAIAAGFKHYLALNADGTVTAWGWGLRGVTNVPAGLSNVTAVAAGYAHNLARKADGTVAAWGDNSYGAASVPPGLTDVVAVACGDSHSLALRRNGRVIAWGANDAGQTNVPPGLSNVVAIAGGAFHNLALTDRGRVVAWGRNTEGQTNVPPDLDRAVAIAASAFTSVALLAEGTAVSWGDAQFWHPAPPTNFNHLVAIATGDSVVLGLRADGTVVQWSDGGAFLSRLPPGLTNVVALATRGNQNLALLGSDAPFLVAPPLAWRGYTGNDLTLAGWYRLPPAPGDGTGRVMADPAPTPAQRFYRVHQR